MALRENDPAAATVREDGFGARSVVAEPQIGYIERLDLTPALSSPSSEQAIRARAAYLTNLPESPLGRVLRILRRSGRLTVLSAAPDGVPLCDLLAALEFNTISLSGEELLELAMSVLSALATMHEKLPTLAHGALTPEHIVMQRDGSAMLTGAIYGDALQALQKNREHLWRDFGVALPPAASLPRFDQRGDVTQIGVAVLAITLRRSLRRDEYPRGTNDLALAVTVSTNPSVNSKLRQWLQDALQLHGRAVFSSGRDAARAFGEVLPPASERTLEALALQTAIRQLIGDDDENLPHLRAS